MNWFITATQAEEAVHGLEERGYVYLPDCSEDFLHEFIRLLGHVVYITDVTVKEGSRALVTSERGLNLHTDHPLVEYIVWYCYRQCDEGGESLVLDPLQAYLALSSEHQRALREIRLYQHKVFPDDPDSFPLVSEENGRIRFYYSFWLTNEKDKQNPAFIDFISHLRRLEPIKIKLKSRDILAIDNLRMLHGRTPIMGNKDRFLKRFWIMKKPKTCA